MKKVLISDVSLVLLFPKDRNYLGSLNQLYKDTRNKPNFDFFDYFEVNTQLLAIYKKHIAKLDYYIFTSDAIQDEPVLQPYWQDLFTGIYSAAKMGVHKSELRAYATLTAEIRAQPKDILYIDDSQTNVSAANSCGLNAFVYQSNAQVEELLESQL